MTEQQKAKVWRLIGTKSVEKIRHFLLEQLRIHTLKELAKMAEPYYTWSEEHLDPYCIMRMPDQDEQGVPAARLTCNSEELTGKNTGSVVTMRYNRSKE